jgi:hypothetical protein
MSEITTTLSQADIDHYNSLLSDPMYEGWTLGDLIDFHKKVSSEPKPRPIIVEVPKVQAPQESVFESKTLVPYVKPIEYEPREYTLPDYELEVIVCNEDTCKIQKFVNKELVEEAVFKKGVKLPKVAKRIRDERGEIVSTTESISIVYPGTILYRLGQMISMWLGGYMTKDDMIKLVRLSIVPDLEYFIYKKVTTDKELLIAYKNAWTKFMSDIVNSVQEISTKKLGDGVRAFNADTEAISKWIVQTSRKKNYGDEKFIQGLFAETLKELASMVTIATSESESGRVLDFSRPFMRLVNLDNFYSSKSTNGDRESASSLAPIPLSRTSEPLTLPSSGYSFTGKGGSVGRGIQLSHGPLAIYAIRQTVTQIYYYMKNARSLYEKLKTRDGLEHICEETYKVLEMYERAYRSNPSSPNFTIPDSNSLYTSMNKKLGMDMASNLVATMFNWYMVLETSRDLEYYYKEVLSSLQKKIKEDVSHHINEGENIGNRILMRIHKQNEPIKGIISAIAGEGFPSSLVGFANEAKDLEPNSFRDTLSLISADIVSENKKDPAKMEKLIILCFTVLAILKQITLKSVDEKILNTFLFLGKMPQKSPLEYIDDLTNELLSKSSSSNIGAGFFSRTKKWVNKKFIRVWINEIVGKLASDKELSQRTSEIEIRTIVNKTLEKIDIRDNKSTFIFKATDLAVFYVICMIFFSILETIMSLEKKATMLYKSFITDKLRELKNVRK